MGEDILQPHQPEQHTPVGLGRQRVANDVEFNDPSALFQASRFISSCVGRKQARLDGRRVLSKGFREVGIPSPTHWQVGLPTSGPSMAAGSVIVSMTSLTSSMGMSPITRSRLASSRVRFSGSFLFSPAGEGDRITLGKQEMWREG